MVIHIIFFLLSLLLTLLFFIYGFNHYYLMIAAQRYHPAGLDTSRQDRPSVTVHLPIYNEKYVVRRLVDACSRMAEAYGRDQVKLLILDDSDDDTGSEIDRITAEYLKKGFHIQVLRRGTRQGFKAGALETALAETTDEFIAIFDADFTPAEDFLVCTVPHFVQDENLGIIQSRWTHLNRDYNNLTRTIAIGIDIHFLIEQTGRFAAGLFQNFNGSGGVLRKTAILEAGGWQADTLAEDLDLSYRIQLAGYSVLYLKDLASPAEIPPTIPSFKKQQGRWACGSLRTARKILPRLLQDPRLGFRQRLEGFIHLTGYMIQPLMSISFLLTCAAPFLGLHDRTSAVAYLLVPPGWIPGILGGITLSGLQNAIWMFLGPLIVLCTIAPWISAISILSLQHLSVSRNLISLLMLLLLGLGISLNNTLEAARGLFSNRHWDFNRTPKYASLKDRQEWRGKRYQISLDHVWLLELLFAGLGAAATWWAVWRSDFSMLLILVPFTLAYGFICFQTVQQSQGLKVV